MRTTEQWIYNVEFCKQSISSSTYGQKFASIKKVNQNTIRYKLFNIFGWRMNMCWRMSLLHCGLHILMVLEILATLWITHMDAKKSVGFRMVAYAPAYAD